MRLLLSVLLVFFLPCLVYAKSEEIVAIVNKQPITRSDLQQAKALTVFLNHIQIQNAEQDAYLNRAILQSMIDEEVVKQYAAKISLKVNDNEVENAIKSIEQRNKMAPGQLQKNIEKAHISLDLFKEKIRGEILRSKIVNEVLGSNIDVSSDEVVSAILDSNIRDARLSLKVFTAKKNTDKAYRSMSKLSSRIKNCNNIQDLRFQSFATVEDIETNLSHLSPNLQARVKDLSIGEATGATREQAGIQVVVLCERKIEDFGSEEATHVSQLIANKQLSTKARKFLQNLRKKAYVKVMI